MGGKATIAKARQELEALYLGVPDESVDLTFKDMTIIQQNNAGERNLSFKNMARKSQNDVGERKRTYIEPIHEDPQEEIKTVINDLNKSPSLDFSKALQGTKPLDRHTIEDEIYRERLARNTVRRNEEYDNVSVFSTLSTLDEKGGKKRPGIPHSNICTSCSEYIYVFRHRCLVCGRVYCRNCVGDGMGEMSEGRKCVDCLGRRFSQRYIHRAGRTGCWWRYSSAVKQQELVWAEKGPRKSRERRRHNDMSSIIDPRSRSHVMMPGTPTRSHAMPGSPYRFRVNDHVSSTSFVANSITAFSPNPHNFPL